MRCQICNAILHNPLEEQAHLKLHASNSSQCDLFFATCEPAAIPKPQSEQMKPQSQQSKPQNHQTKPKNQRKSFMKKPVSIGKTILVKGCKPPLSQEDVLEHFSKFGPIHWYKAFKESIEILFEKLESAKEARATHVVYVNGVKLLVTPKESYFDTILQIKYPDIEVDLVSAIPKNADIDAQFEIINNYLWLSRRDETHANHKAIIADLETVVRVYDPECTVHIVGPSMFGLNYTERPIDVFITVSAHKESVHHIDVIYRIKALLEKSEKFLINRMFKESLDGPIIYSLHKPANIKLILNVSDLFSVCNSNLIRNILDIHEKLRAILLFLTNYFDKHKVNISFNIYALCHMFIFYLQTINKLPPVKDLAKFETGRDIYKGWKDGLNQFNPDKYKDNFQWANGLDMLKGFFCFYGYFDYANDAICPYIGNIIRKASLMHPPDVPNEYEIYKSKLPNKHINDLTINAFSYICVQDPFKHDLNITREVNREMLSKIIYLCRFGYSTCVKKEPNPLHNLLCHTFSPGQILDILPAGSFSLKRRVEMDYLDRSKPIMESWLKIVCDFTKMVLKDFLKFEISENQTGIEFDQTRSKQIRLQGQKDVFHQPGKNIFHCFTKLNLWSLRQDLPIEIKSIANNADNFIIKELTITNHLLKSYSGGKNKEIISFDLVIESNTDADIAYFKIINVNKANAFVELYEQLEEYMVHQFPFLFYLYENHLKESQTKTLY